MNGQPPDSPPPEPRKRVGWLRREGIDLGDAVVQFFSVLLGVLLALLISQWTHHRQQEAQAHAAMLARHAKVNEAMRAIRVELTDNRAQLHFSVGQLFAAAKRMYNAPANQKQPPRPCYEWRRFSSVGIYMNLTDAAYQTAIATRAIADMPFQQAHTVAEVYGGQHVLESGLNLIRNDVLFARPETLKVCASMMEDMGLSERLIDNAYTSLIGPDKAPWPKPPFPIPAEAAQALKRGTS